MKLILLTGSEPRHHYFRDYIASKTKVKTVKLAQSVGAIEGADSYIHLFETNLKILSKAFGVEHD